MKLSPVYDEIKSRALELLNAESGFNGFSREEVWNRNCSRWQRRNNVGVALCMARDEVQRRECKLTANTTLDEWRDARRRMKFTSGNFKKAEIELTKLIALSRHA